MLKELLWWWWLRTYFEVGLKINKNVAKSTKTLQFRSINCNFLHFLAITCNSVQLLAILCNNLQFRAIAFNFLQYLAEYCATSCNLVITCNYILLFASSRSWILLNLVFSNFFFAIQFFKKIKEKFSGWNAICWNITFIINLAKMSLAKPSL